MASSYYWAQEQYYVRRWEAWEELPKTSNRPACDETISKLAVSVVMLSISVDIEGFVIVKL